MTRAQLPSRALFRSSGLEMFQDRFELFRADREIKQPVAARAAFLVDLVQPFGQTFETGLVGEIALMIKNRLREVLPDFIAHRLTRELFDRFFHFLAKIVIGLRATRETDDCDGRRQFAIGGEIVERRKQLAMSEIAGCAEDHDAARLRHGAGR